MLFQEMLYQVFTKSFVRPYLDYGDISYHQPNNKSMNNKLECTI